MAMSINNISDKYTSNGILNPSLKSSPKKGSGQEDSCTISSLAKRFVNGLGGAIACTPILLTLDFSLLGNGLHYSYHAIKDGTFGKHTPLAERLFYPAAAVFALSFDAMATAIAFLPCALAGPVSGFIEGVSTSASNAVKIAYTELKEKIDYESNMIHKDFSRYNNDLK